jgi:hypothetical protein
LTSSILATVFTIKIWRGSDKPLQSYRNFSGYWLDLASRCEFLSILFLFILSSLAMKYSAEILRGCNKPLRRYRNFGGYWLDPGTDF